MFYGLCYFMIHDVLIHQRFKWFKHTNNKYLIGLRKAQKLPNTWVKNMASVWNVIRTVQIL
jgi:hypothetical protein